MNLFGVLLTLIGALMAAVYAITLRTLLHRGKSEEERPEESVLNGGVMATAAVLLFATVFATRTTIELAPGFWKYVAITGALNILISYLGFKALQTKDDVSLVVPIRDTTPAAVVLTSWVIVGERPSAFGYVGILLLVAGTYTLNIQGLVEQLHSGRWTWRAFLEPWLALGRSRGVRLAFAASAIGCLAIPFDGLASRAGPPLFALACVISFSAVAHTARALAKGAGSQFFDRRRGMPYAALVGGALFAIATGFFWWSFRFLFVAYQATVKRSETFFVVILAYLILRERKSFRSRLVAVLLMSIGVILISRG
ncbi:MAG: DMT family transporter [Patescibacteria group bacterium]|nr:DMT family transporter [Patescibacteria group bacterium]